MKSMFRELEKPKEEVVLIGLKIVKVISTFAGVLKEFECEDEQGEMHSIEFKHGIIVVDGDEVLVTNQESY